MTPSAEVPSGALHGCSVVVTREQRGELGRMLAELGADVVHVPLIRTVDPADDDIAALAHALAGPLDWLIVTSAAGADRVSQVAGRPDVRLAAVGTATARRLEEVAGRPVDLVPSRQLAADLVEEFARRQKTPATVLVAQADRAASTLTDGIAAAGHHVTTITAYSTELREPAQSERRQIEKADAIAFASGSAAESFAAALGDVAPGSLPPLVVAIGPTTSEAATRSGLRMTHVSSVHSLSGLVATLCVAWHDHRGT